MLLQQQQLDNSNNNSEDDEDVEQQQHELNKRSASKFANYRINRGLEESYFEDQDKDLLKLKLMDDIDDLKNQSEHELFKRSTPSGSTTVCAPVRYVVCYSTNLPSESGIYCICRIL
jgi:hypothetical protein